MTVRIGKLRDSDVGRGWRAKLYGPTTAYPHHRVKFKDPATSKWVDRPVPAGECPDGHFDLIEHALDRRVTQPSEKSGRQPIMTDLALRYLEWLTMGDRDEMYVNKVKNLLDVWVLATDGDLVVARWSPEHSAAWIKTARTRCSAARVEDLGVAIAGLRSTAHRKGPDGTRWLDPTENPLEGVNFSRVTTIEGTHRSYVPPSKRPTTDQVNDLLGHAESDCRWAWMPTQIRVGSFCGPRLAEQMALRAVDVDFERRRLLIRLSVRWPRPSSGTEWGLKRTKTRRSRAVPYPASLDEPLLAACRNALGLAADASAAQVTAAQQAHYAARLEHLDDQVLRNGRPRPISEHDLILFAADGDHLPPTKEAYGVAWRSLRDQSTWPNAIPWRNARHHTATWWRSTVRGRNGAALEWEVIAQWLGHSVKTCLEHYVLAGEDDEVAARDRLDGL